MNKRIGITSMGLVIVAVLLAGCGDGGGPVGTDDGPVDFFASLTQTKDPTYGQLSITSTWTRQSGSVSYECGGQVFDDTNHSTHVSGGSVVVSDLPAPERSPGIYLTMNAPVFGSVAEWSLSGNSSAGIPAVTDSMYLPAEIRILSPAVKTYSRSQDLTLTWNADANNDIVMIRVRDASEPASPFVNPQYEWSTVVPDNGSYTVTSSILSNMPSGALAVVSLTRGESKTIGTTHKFHIYGYTTAADAYRLTP